MIILNHHLPAASHLKCGIQMVSLLLLGEVFLMPNLTLLPDNGVFTVYTDGRVCISILHNPGDDPHGYEVASERWSPVHTVCPGLMLQNGFMFTVRLLFWAVECLM